MSFQFVNARENIYSDTDVLIDTGSTCSVMKNDDMLLNITNSDKTLHAYANGGDQDSNLRGDFPGFFRVWLNRNSMLNILAFKDVRERFCVTVDTLIENAICVHMDNGSILKVQRSGVRIVFAKW